MKKKIFILGLILVAGLLILTGCGSNNSNTSNNLTENNSANTIGQNTEANQSNVSSSDIENAIASMTPEEIQTFNAPYVQYIGNHISGTAVKYLISSVATNNDKIGVFDPTSILSVNGKTTDSELYALSDSVAANNIDLNLQTYYTVTAKYIGGRIIELDFVQE